MINSRRLEDLEADVAVKARAFLTLCSSELDPSLHVIIVSTYRDFDTQAALYAQGRTAPGKIVTWAGPGDSFHNWRVAFDVAIYRNGKYVDDKTDADKAIWAAVGMIGERCGLEWAGRWKTRRESAHFQAAGVTIAWLKSENERNA